MNELNTLIKVGDIALVNEIRSSGVKLFYTLISEYKIMKSCSFTEQFLLNILQSIGNVCNTCVINKKMYNINMYTHYKLIIINAFRYS